MTEITALVTAFFFPLSHPCDKICLPHIKLRNKLFRTCLSQANTISLLTVEIFACAFLSRHPVLQEFSFPYGL